MSEDRVPASAYTTGQGDPVPRYRRNPRRAYDREGREIRPMDLANAADNGVTMLRAFCPPPCRHEGEVSLDKFPNTTAVCCVCGTESPNPSSRMTLSNEADWLVSFANADTRPRQFSARTH